MDNFPPAPRTRRSGQGKLWLGVLIALIAVAGTGYFVMHELRPELSSSPAPESTGTSQAEKPSEPAPAESAPATNTNRSETILTCSAVNGTIFYTNATRCEDADLENKVNVVSSERVQASPVRQCLGAQPGGPRVQAFSAACMEPFNKALELEPFLLESDDPAASRAGQRYCAYITAGVQAGCMATSNQFCFLDICQAQREAGGQ